MKMRLKLIKLFFKNELECFLTLSLLQKIIITIIMIPTSIIIITDIFMDSNNYKYLLENSNDTRN